MIILPQSFYSGNVIERYPLVDIEEETLKEIICG